MPHALSDSMLKERLADAAQAIVARLVTADRAGEQLGEVFLACEQAARDCPDECREALRDGALEEFLLPRVRAGLRRERGQSFNGGWLGTYVGPDCRPVETAQRDAEAETEPADPEALEISAKALTRAESRAAAEGNAILARNLHWYRERLAHKSYAAIARAEGKVPATVRTGVARARKFVLRAVHELRSAQPAPLSGTAPATIEPLRRLWVDQDLERLEVELERTRAEHGDDPHWLNLAALLAADHGDREQAVRLFERALVFADAPNVRGRVLNNLANLADDVGLVEDAQRYLLRANQLVPHAPAPLVNLLAAASQRRDYASAQHHIAQLADLLNAGRLDAGERAYLRRRLQEHPRLDWLRETDAWRLGPERWIRSLRPSRAVSLALAAAATAAATLLLLLVPVPALAQQGDAVDTYQCSPGGDSMPDDKLAQRRPNKRGGDSMGKPPRRITTPPAPDGEPWLVAGDSMGRRPGGGTPRPPRPTSG